jgi:signal transduction histidine kinase
VLVVGVAFVLASFVMLNYVERSLAAQVGDEAELRARELTDVPAAIADGVVIPVAEPKEQFVQVLDGGRAVAASDNVAGLPALVVLEGGEETRLDSVPFAAGPFEASGVETTTAQGHRVVVVGLNIDDVLEARHVVALALLIGGPLLLIVVATVTWWIVGRALRPVEDIRAEVERISARDLHRRVPVSAGGDEVARLADTMNLMLDRLERAQQRQRRFVSDASHELRSPAASIRQHAEVAQQHPDGTNIQELAEVVLEEDARLQRMVEDLLLLARLDEGAVEATSEVDLDDVMVAEAAHLRSTTALEVDMGRVSAGRVTGNEAQLQRLVRNLTDNAARHARANIALGLAELDGHVVLSVDDDGPGIPADERTHVFERFVRLDEARARDTGGTGLGLAIVREVAAAHGAEVAVGESPDLGGLRVEVRFPSGA